MKIIYFIVTLIFMMRHYPCLRATGNPSLKSSSNPLLNFIQIANKKNSNRKKSLFRDFKYDVRIAVIKQTDEKDDNPLEYNNQVMLTKNSIDIYETGVIKKQISYLDFLFMDGVVLFNNLDYFNKIQNEIYNDLMTQLKPKIIRYAENFGKEDFNKFCFFAFRSKYQDDKIKQLGKIYTAVIFCLSKDTTDEVLIKYTDNFMTYYTDKIVEEKNLMKIQNYRLKQNIQIQYYDPMEKINSENPKLPNFYTSFAKEGLVLNEDPHYDPLKVKYSFRFDQVVECSGGEASTLKAILNPVISGLFRPDYCCVSYLVDWQQKGVKNMFCSMYQKDWMCKADIKIFQSTLFQFCIMNQIEKLNKVLIESNNNIRESKLYFLERASIITVIREILYTEIEIYMDQSSYLYYLVSKEKKRAKYDLYDALRSFDLDTNSGKGKSKKKGCVFGKEEFLLDESKSEFIIINEEKMIINDFETVNRREQKSLYDNAAMSIQILKEMKISFCKELWRMKVEDEDIEIKTRRNKTTIINRETLIIRRIKRIRNIAIYIINIIKRRLGNRKLTDREIIIITNIIIRHSELFIYVIRFRIEITIEIINILIINEEYGITIIWKLVKEKMFKLRYEDDPTHGNSTLGCNITKEHDPPGPYPPPGPFPIPDEFNIADDLTGYIDEADYMKIPGIPVDYIDKEKSTNSTITIPRTIPKLGLRRDPPKNFTPPKNISDNDTPIIGDEEPTPLFPMNPNPGVDDDPDGNRDLIPPPTPNITCIGPHCKPKENGTHIDIDCSGPDCLIPFPTPPDTLPCNKTIKCTEGVDCPCVKGVNCPCTEGVDCPKKKDNITDCPGPNCPDNCPGPNCPNNCTGSDCPKNCTGSDCPKNCTGSDCPNNCTGSDCPKNCPGPNCPPNCPGPNCKCPGEDCPCPGPNCPADCPGPNCPPNCPGLNCKCPGEDCPCPGPNCPNKCPGPNCPNNCPGPNCPPNCPGPNCKCPGEDCPCPGPNCPNKCPGPNCPANCPGPNCPPNCPGPNCKCPGEDCPCPGPNCPNKCPGPNCPPNCPGPNCPPNCPGPNCKCPGEDCPCPGPNCPNKCPGPNCPNNCPGPNCPPNCPGPNCKCPGEDCPCPGPNCPNKCPGPNCPPNCPGPNCPPNCPGPNCKCPGEDCPCPGPNCPNKCPGPNCPNNCPGPNCSPNCPGPNCKCPGEDCPCPGPNCPCGGKPCPQANNSSDFWVYSAQTIYNNDPLNRPRIEGLIVKNQVEDPDAKKLLDLFGKINESTDVQGNGSNVNNQDANNNNQNGNANNNQNPNVNNQNGNANNNMNPNVNNNMNPNMNSNPNAGNINAVNNGVGNIVQNVNPNVPQVPQTKRLKRLR